MSAPEANPYFLALLQQYEMIGMVGLGKLADPMSGETRVDLDQTRVAIAMLEMLEQKTQTGLVDLERQELRRMLTSLRLNFVAEQRAAAAAKEAAAGAPKEPETEAPGSKATEPQEQAEGQPTEQAAAGEEDARGDQGQAERERESGSA